MTNLSGTGSPWQHSFTRQRVLVAAPLLVGVLIGAGVFAIAGLPHWLASGERTRRIAELKVQPRLKRLVAQQVVDVLDQVIALVLFDQVQRPGKGGNDDALKKERANAHVERRQIREIECEREERERQREKKRQRETYRERGPGWLLPTLCTCPRHQLTD